MLTRGQPALRATRSDSPPRPIAIVRPSASFEERHRIETEKEAERVRREREAAKIERERVRNEGWNRIQEERKARKEAREAAEKRREERREREKMCLVRTYENFFCGYADLGFVIGGGSSCQ